MTDEPIAWPGRPDAIPLRTDRAIADELRALAKQYNALVLEAAGRGIEVYTDFDYPPENEVGGIAASELVVHISKVL